MRKLKIMSALMSAVMCVSMVMAPVTVFADEDTAPEETQAVEETEKPAPKETQKPAPEEKEDPEETQKEEPAESEKPETAETEKQPEEQEPQEKEPEAIENPAAETEDSKEAVDAAKVIASGKCGKNLKWTITDAKVLKITGKGAMYNYVIRIKRRIRHRG